MASQPHPSDYDPNNTTLFIGGLSSGVSEDDLRVLFGRFGDIVYTKIPPGKGCGFVQFVQRPAAETAMAQMQVHVCAHMRVPCWPTPLQPFPCLFLLATPALFKRSQLYSCLLKIYGGEPLPRM